ncbi:MAG TPA: FtsX-like permease family protein [Pseudolysinimonas sp.]|jgi:putative ABC transport system permease protein
MSGRWTARRLLVRRAMTRPAASVLVAVLALLTVAVAAAVPRLVEQQSTAELAYQLKAIGPVGRSLQGSANFPEPWSIEGAPAPDLDQIYSGLQSAFDTARESLPPLLRGQVGAPQWIAQSPTLPVTQLDGASTLLGLQLTADPSYLTKIHVVQGSTPATWTASDTEPAEATRSIPIDVVISTEAAATLKLKPGDIIGAAVVGGVAGTEYRVSGLFEPRDAGSDYWKQNPSLLPASTALTPRGVAYPSAAVFVDPLTVGRTSATFGSARITLYYPVRAEGVEGADAGLLRSQLDAVVAAGIAMPDDGRTMPVVTQSDQAAETAVERGALLAGLLALLAAAPIGLVFAVLLLGVQVVVRARRADLVLASARGASGLQVRGSLALEGALLSVPAAIAVTALATALIPVRIEPSGFVLPALVAVAVPALYAVLPVTAAAPGPVVRLLAQLRGVAEIAVVLFAVLSLILLARRGLAQTATMVGVDPLLSVAPLLLAVSVGIVVLRGYPLPMRAARRAATRSRGLTAFIGAIRATRSPTIGLAGVLALVVGISVSLFSTVLLTTFSAGIEQAASESVGADARVDGSALSPAVRTAVAGVDGVREVAGIQYLSSATVEHSPITDTVTMLLAQTAPLGSLRALPPDLAVEVDGRVPVVVSADLLEQLGRSRTATIDGVKVRVVGSLPAASGLGPRDDWMIADAVFAPRFQTTFAPATLLIRADPAARSGLGSPVRRAASGDPDAVVTTVAEASADRAAEPVVSGIRIGLLAGAVISVLLCALALVLSTVAAGAARGRTAGILRTLGMPRRRLTDLIAWELVPVAVVALLAGAALGLLLPVVVTTAVDLRPFTGGLVRPVPLLDPLLLAAVLAAFAAVVLGAGAVAVAVGDRISPSSTLKMGAS